MHQIRQLIEGKLTVDVFMKIFNDCIYPAHVLGVGRLGFTTSAAFKNFCKKGDDSYLKVQLVL